VYGHRRVLLVGIVIGLTGTLVIAMAPDERLLLLGRALSGIGIGACLPPAIATVADSGGEHVGRAIGRYLATASLVMLGAPLAAALLNELASWRAVFLLEALLLVAPLVLTWTSLPHRPRAVDVPLALPACILAGVAFACLSLGAQRAGIDGWSAPLILGLLGLGGVALVALILHDRRSSAPVFNRSVLRSATVRRDTSATFLLGGIVGITMVFTTLLIARDLRFSTIETSLFLMLLLLPQVLVSRFAGRLYDRHGFNRIAALGSLFTAPAIVVLAFGATLGSPYVIGAGLFALGVGLGVLVTLTSSDPQRAVPGHLRAETSGLVSTGRNLGGATLVAIAMTLAASVGITAPFWFAVILVVVLVPLITLPQGRLTGIAGTYELPSHGLPRALIDAADTRIHHG
jgi:DHA2 family lincomycin resistance protein-like MFS transporter